MVSLGPPRVPGGTHVLVGSPPTEGELNGLGLAEQRAAGGQQPAPNRGCRWRDPIAPRRSPTGRDPAIDIDDVLQCKRHTVERTDSVAVLDSRRCGVG